MEIISLDNFQVAAKDLYEDKLINFYDFKMPEDLNAEGWRLPTPAELREILNMENGNFVEEWYMTSERAENDWRNLCIEYTTRKELFMDFTESHRGRCRIRLVKDL